MLEVRQRRGLVRVGRGKRLHQPRHLRRIHAAIDDDPLDAGLLQPAHQLAHVLGGARQRNLADDEILAHDADGQ